MTENVENLILEHLKALRSGQNKLENSIDELTLRMSSVEGHIAGVRGDLSMLHSDIAVTHKRLDSLDKRVDRIEKRLELVS